MRTDYVVFGAAAGLPCDPHHTNGFRLDGVAKRDYSGFSVPMSALGIEIQN
jgi:hypothetical protein